MAVINLIQQKEFLRVRKTVSDRQRRAQLIADMCRLNTIDRSVLAVLVYAGGHISGAHYNPAVSLAVMVRGKATAADMFAYWIAQIIAAAAAAFVVGALKPHAALAAVVPPVGPALLAEFLFTFALAFVVLNVATTRGTEGNSYYGFAIGFTVLVGAFAVGNISGGAFNPAVAVGLVVMGLVDRSGHRH